jgi:hypothetical protein
VVTPLGLFARGLTIVTIQTIPDSSAKAAASQALGWESAAVALGAAFAGWSLGRGKALGVVAGVAAAAGARALSQRSVTALSVLPTRGADPIVPNPEFRFVRMTEEAAPDEDWPKLALGLLEVVQNLSRHPAKEDVPPVSDWAVEAGSGRFEDLLWFEAKDLAHDLIQSASPSSVSSEMAEPKAEAASAPEHFKEPELEPLPCEGHVHEALMAALDADEASSFESPLSISELPADPEPVKLERPPEVPLQVMEFEQPIRAEAIMDLLKPDPDTIVQSLSMAEPAAAPLPVVRQVFQSTSTAEQLVAAPLPPRREKRDESWRPLSTAYATQGLLRPMAPNSEKPSPRSKLRLILVICMLVVALLASLPFVRPGTFGHLRDLLQGWRSAQPGVQEVEIQRAQTPEPLAVPPEKA